MSGTCIQRFVEVVVLLGAVAILAGCPEGTFFGIEVGGNNGDSNSDTGNGDQPVDDSAPSIAVVNPRDGQVLSGELFIAGTAVADSGVERVELRINEDPWVVLEGRSTWSRSVNTFELSEGSHTLAVWAINTLGNSSELSRTFRVDQTVPSANFDVDLENFEHYIQGENVVLRGRARDNVGVAKVELSSDGGAHYSEAVLTDTGEEGGSMTYEWTFEIADTAALVNGDGSLEARVRATNSEDLVGSSSIPLFVDNTPPVITAISNPESGAEINANDIGQVLRIAGSHANDGKGPVRRVSVRVDPESGGNGIDWTEASLDNGTFEAALDISAVEMAGASRIRVRAEDRAGNFSVEDYVDVMFDAAPPSFDDNFERDSGEDGEEWLLLDGDLSSAASNVRERNTTFRGSIGSDHPDDSFLVEWWFRDAQGEDLFDMQTVDGAPDANGDWSTSFDFAGSMPGTSETVPEGEIFLVARVENDRKSIAVESRALRFDPTIPDVQISPLDSIGIHDVVSLDFTIANAVGGREVELRRLWFRVVSEDGSVVYPHDGAIGIAGAGPQSESYLWDTRDADPALEAGNEYIVEAWAVDLAGNAAGSTDAPADTTLFTLDADLDSEK